MLRRYSLIVGCIILVLFSLAGCSGSSATQAGLLTGQAPTLAPTTASQAGAVNGNAAPSAAPATQSSAAQPTAVLSTAAPATSAPTATQAATAALPVTGATFLPATPQSCQPTPPDMLGPFYKPGAPERSQVGQGYVLTGVVRSAADCAPIPGAMVELWMAGPDGNYADAFRATIITGPDGAYRFESHVPPPYSGRPPHIHLRVTADGYGELVTQHYPSSGQTQAAFDLVLTKR